MKRINQEENMAQAAVIAANEAYEKIISETASKLRKARNDYNSAIETVDVADLFQLSEFRKAMDIQETSHDKTEKTKAWKASDEASMEWVRLIEVAHLADVALEEALLECSNSQEAIWNARIELQRQKKLQEQMRKTHKHQLRLFNKHQVSDDSLLYDIQFIVQM